MLILMSYPTLSQDTLEVIEPISYKGNVGLFIDSASVKKLAHKLEEGRLDSINLNLAYREIEICDSTISKLKHIVSIQDSTSIVRDGIIAIEQDKVSIWKDKFNASEKKRKKTRRMGLFACIGSSLIGLLIGLSIK